MRIHISILSRWYFFNSLLVVWPFVLYLPSAFNYSFTFFKTDQIWFPSNIALINGNLRRISTYFCFSSILFLLNLQKIISTILLAPMPTAVCEILQNLKKFCSCPSKRFYWSPHPFHKDKHIFTKVYFSLKCCSFLRPSEAYLTCFFFSLYIQNI